MKVKAININGAKNITLNKEYDVVEELVESFVIKNDLAREGTYKKDRFIKVEIVIPTPKHKVGNTYKDTGEVRYILIADGNLVSLVCLATGLIVNGFHHVVNLNNISEEEMKRIDSDWITDPLTLVS